jgi:anti-sigma B factor antagonist
VSLVLRGELDLSSCPSLRATLDGLGPYRVIEVDCRELEFLDSTGIAMLLGLHRRLEREQRRVVLTGLMPRIRRVLQIAGVDDALAIVA